MNFRTAFRVLAGAYLTHQPGRTLLTVLGVALGVGVLVAIDLANESAVASFRNTVDDVAGRAALTVRSAAGGLDPEIVPQVSWAEGVQAAAPLIEGRASFEPEEAPPESMLFFGVDLLASTEPEDVSVRDLRFELMEGLGFGDLLTNPELLIFTELFTDRHGLSVGDQTELRVGGSLRPFTVAGIISGGTLSTTLDGNVVIADAGIADVLLRRGGNIDRIDIVPEPGTDPEKLAERLEAQLGTGIVIEKPESRSGRVDEMLAAFRFNLNALGHLAVLVGAFLIFNSVSIAVVRRRTEIGTLRAMGVTRGTIRAVFLIEGALLGIAGSIAGIVGGIVAARLMLGVVTDAISINFFQADATGLALDLSIPLFAFGLGLASSLLASFAPAQEAASTPPANTMRRGTLEQKKGRTGTLVVIGLIAALAGVAFLLPEPRPGLPVSGYAASACFIVTFICWIRPVLGPAAAAVRRPVSRLMKAEGMLAVAGMRSSPGRSSVAIGGLLLSVAMTVSVSVMVSSFRETVVVWMEQVLKADVFVSATTGGALASAPPLPEEFAERVEQIPGVERIDPFRSQEVLINGRPAFVGGGRLDVVQFANETAEGRPTTEVMRAAKENDSVVVSEAFARRQGIEGGDTVDLPTPGGLVTLTVEGVYYDYSSEKGYVIMDRALYKRLYNDPLVDSVSLYLSENADRSAVRGELNALASEMNLPPLDIRANSELRTLALEAFDRTFAVTYVLQIIAIAVAALGITTTLLAQIMDRREELTTLRWLGATRKRVARVVVLESGLLGVIGIVMGIGAGLILSYILTTRIMLESFGWTIGYNVPWLLVAQIGVVVFVATLLAGLLPARETARLTGSTAGGGAR